MLIPVLILSISFHFIKLNTYTHVPKVCQFFSFFLYTCISLKTRLVLKRFSVAIFCQILKKFMLIKVDSTDF